MAAAIGSHVVAPLDGRGMLCGMIPPDQKKGGPMSELGQSGVAGESATARALSTAAYVQWGKGKHHVYRFGESATVCGKQIPFPVHTAIYSPSVCSRCEKADGEAVKTAEQERKRIYAEMQSQLDARVARSRAGTFDVWRCRKCGTQHQKPGRGPGVAFCTAEYHEADLEHLEVTGPEWKEPTDG